MKSNLKETLEIAATSAAPRVKLQARTIANDCYKFILDMTNNAGIVSKYVTQKTELVNTLEKLDERIEAKETDEELLRAAYSK